MSVSATSRTVCPVVELTVRDHPDADRLEIAGHGGYQMVVGKGVWSTGDRAVYVPEASVLPDSLIEEMGLTGRLAGKARNRVKAVRLRGVVSQGLVVPLGSPHLPTFRNPPQLGDDLAEALGIVKWEPPIPPRMDGVAEPCPWPSGFDVDSWQKHPDLFVLGERVQVTEKLHGTFCLLGYDPHQGSVAASKRMAGKARFAPDDEENAGNLYVRAWREHADRIVGWAETHGRRLQLLGEIVGPKVQDLTYGQQRPTFMAFDAKVGYDTLNPEQTQTLLADLGVPSVPVVEGSVPFDHDLMLRLAAAPSSFGGLREGVVVRPVEYRTASGAGRVIVKYVNPAYLLRRGGTEHN